MGRFLTLLSFLYIIEGRHRRPYENAYEIPVKNRRRSYSLRHIRWRRGSFIIDSYVAFDEDRPPIAYHAVAIPISAAPPEDRGYTEKEAAEAATEAADQWVLAI